MSSHWGHLAIYLIHFCVPWSACHPDQLLMLPQARSAWIWTILMTRALRSIGRPRAAATASHPLRRACTVSRAALLLHRTLVARDKMKPLDLTHLTASCIRLADYQKCDKTVNTAYLQFAARIEGKPFTLDRPDASQGGMRARSTTAAF